MAPRTESKPVSLSRRALFHGRAASSGVPVVRPPWSLPEPQFLDACKTCSSCLTACEEGILKRGAGGYPEVDFQAGECTFCGACATACATSESHAIYAQDIETARPWALEARIGSGCLSANGVTCRVCGERCDARAIRFQLAVGGIANPIIDQESCTGCGACVAPCPVDVVEVIHNQNQVATRPVGAVGAVQFKGHIQLEEQS